MINMVCDVSCMSHNVFCGTERMAHLLEVVRRWMLMTRTMTMMMIFNDDASFMTRVNIPDDVRCSRFGGCAIEISSCNIFVAILRH